MIPDHESFAWLTTRAAEIAQLLHSPGGRARTLGEELLEELLTIREELLPGRAERHATARRARVAASAERLATAGRERWEELHRHALATVTEESAEHAWLSGFGARLSCGDCRVFFEAYLTAHPPRFGEYFAWTVELHNAVNAKLGKPALDLAAARGRWG